MRTTATLFGAAVLTASAILIAGAAALSLSAMAFGGANDDDTDDICSLPPDVGPCDGVFPRWYFNPESGQCEQFIYGGCGGNANNFETLEECTEACGDICQLPPDPGPCDGHFPRWYFNPESGQCEMFIYGGCEGNANNFETLEECTEACGDICQLPPDPGPCDGHFPRWYFNPQSGQCEQFIYGGCEGNANNFETLEECTEACGDICQLPPDPGPCDGYFPRWYFNPESGQCEQFIYGGCEGNANNFETLEECTDACGDICQLPPDPGPCDGHFPRWYFNPESGQCEQFIYGGCEGNANNFETLEECTEVCGGPATTVDLTGDGIVNVMDMLALLNTWGDCPAQGGCPADLTGDNVVDTLDMLMLLSEWGPST